MPNNLSSDITTIKVELQKVINELESISKGIRQEYEGIGNVECANCLDKVIDQYELAKSKLNSIDCSSQSDPGIYILKK